MALDVACDVDDRGRLVFRVGNLEVLDSASMARARVDAHGLVEMAHDLQDYVAAVEEEADVRDQAEKGRGPHGQEEVEVEVDVHDQEAKDDQEEKDDHH